MINKISNSNISKLHGKHNPPEEKLPDECAWEIQKPKPKLRGIFSAVIVVALVIVVVAAVAYSWNKQHEPEIGTAQVVTISTLKEIVEISDLSTVNYVHNGIAEISEDGETKYYVSYDSTVKLGIDFSKITFDIDDEAKIIYANIPSPEIQKIDVDISSIDFIFADKKENKLTVAKTAYEKCVEDAKAECENNSKLFELAQTFAEDTVIALTQPLITECFDGYHLECRKD